MPNRVLGTPERKEALALINVILQLPDTEALARLIADGVSLSDIADDPHIPAFVIEDGRIREGLR